MSETDVIEQFEMAIYVALNLSAAAGLKKDLQSDILAEASEVWRSGRDIYDSKFTKGVTNA